MTITQPLEPLGPLRGRGPFGAHDLGLERLGELALLRPLRVLEIVEERVICDLIRRGMLVIALGKHHVDRSPREDRGDAGRHGGPGHGAAAPGRRGRRPLPS